MQTASSSLALELITISTFQIKKHNSSRFTWIFHFSKKERPNRTIIHDQLNQKIQTIWSHYCLILLHFYTMVFYMHRHSHTITNACLDLYTYVPTMFYIFSSFYFYILDLILRFSDHRKTKHRRERKSLIQLIFYATAVLFKNFSFSSYFCHDFYSNSDFLKLSKFSNFFFRLRCSFVLNTDTQRLSVVSVWKCFVIIL